MGRFKMFALATLLACAALATVGCQSAPQTSSQTGPESSLSAPVRATSPTTQEQPGAVSVGGSTVMVMPGAVPAADGKGGGGITIQVFNGPRASADGDVKGYGKSDTGQTDSKDATQASTPTQTTTLDPAAIAAAATDILKTALPAGQAATLAQSAIDATKTGDTKGAAEALAKARAAAAAEKAGKVTGGAEPGK